MAIHQGKVRFSRAALLEAVDEICSDASAMQGTQPPGEAELNRDHIERVRQFLRRIIGERPILPGKMGWTFELRTEQTVPCIDENCNGIVIATGQHQDNGPNLEDVEFRVRCTECQRRWWH